MMRRNTSQESLESMPINPRVFGAYRNMASQPPAPEITPDETRHKSFWTEAKDKQWAKPPLPGAMGKRVEL